MGTRASLDDCMRVVVDRVQREADGVVPIRLVTQVHQGCDFDLLRRVPTRSGDAG